MSLPEKLAKASPDDGFRGHALHLAYAHNPELSLPQQNLVFREEVRRLDVARRRGEPQRREVLLAGGAGYIGLVVTAALLAADYAVRSADALLYDTGDAAAGYNRDPRFTFMHADFRTADMAALLDGVTDVVILASLVGDPISRRYPLQTRQINVDATLRLLDALQGRPLNKVIFVSTCSNYGACPDDRPVTEDAELRPLSPYAESKVEVERHLLSGAWSFDFTILRFATAFGLSPRMRFDLTVNEFTRELFLDRQLLVYDPDTWRPYCHVRDFGRAIRRVLEFPRERVSGQVFNTGGDENNHTKASLLQVIQEQLPGRRVRHVAGGTDRRNYRADFSKIRDRLAFVPSVTVPQGVAEILAALHEGAFAEVDRRPNFYGNRLIPSFGAIDGGA